MNSCLSSSHPTPLNSTPNYPLVPQSYASYPPFPQYFPIHTPSHTSIHTTQTEYTPLPSSPPTPIHQNTPKTPIKLSYTSIFISIITPWALLCFQLLQQSIILIKNTFFYLLSDILSFDYSSYFQLIFLPSTLNRNQHTINHIPTVFKQNIKQPFTKTATTIYNYLRPYCMQTIFIATFHLFQYSLFTLWA